MQEWVRANPRAARIAARPAPTERQSTQWYFQRYVENLPAAGEIVLLDRSWYNRAGVEHVMGFCTEEQYTRFLHVVESDAKRRARVTMIAHLLGSIPYHTVKQPSLTLPPRPAAQGYIRTPRDMQDFVPDHAADLLAAAG